MKGRLTLSSLHSARVESATAPASVGAPLSAALASRSEACWCAARRLRMSCNVAMHLGLTYPLQHAKG